VKYFTFFGTTKGLGFEIKKDRNNKSHPDTVILTYGAGE